MSTLCALGEIRTPDTFIRSEVLYPLSYEGDLLVEDTSTTRADKQPHYNQNGSQERVTLK